MGFVDEVGAFSRGMEQGNIRLIPFPGDEDAKRALIGEQISEYIVIPSDFSSTGTIRRFSFDSELTIPRSTADMLKRFITANLLAGIVPPHVIDLVVSPLEIASIRLDTDGSIAAEQDTTGSHMGNVIIPAVFSLLLALALMLGSVSLISGLGEEKESRLIEVLFSSVSVRQLLTSKVLAFGSAGLLQVVVWLVSAPLLLNLASSVFGGFMSDISIPANFLLLGIIYFILGYLLFAVLSVGIGAVSTSAREGSELSMIYTLTSFVPLWFSALFFNFPNSVVWVVLSIFPVTAPIQTMLRLGFGDVPLVQIVASVGVLSLSVAVGLYLSIKIFRVHMLMHGKRPGLKEIAENLKSA